MCIVKGETLGGEDEKGGERVYKGFGFGLGIFVSLHSNLHFILSYCYYQFRLAYQTLLLL